jgi:hypothetical protein
MSVTISATICWAVLDLIQMSIFATSGRRMPQRPNWPSITAITLLDPFTLSFLQSLILAKLAVANTMKVNALEAVTVILCTSSRLPKRSKKTCFRPRLLQSKYSNQEAMKKILENEALMFIAMSSTMTAKALDINPFDIKYPKPTVKILSKHPSFCSFQSRDTSLFSK